MYGSLPVARTALRALKDLPGWEAVLLRTKPLSTRPGIPLALRERVRVRSGRRPEARAAVLAEAAIVVPAPTGSARLRLEAAAAGAVLAAPPGALDQPALAAYAKTADGRRHDAYGVMVFALRGDRIIGITEPSTPFTSRSSVIGS